MRCLLSLLVLIAGISSQASAQSASPSTRAVKAGQPAPEGFEFLDTGIENASPLWYETAADGTIDVHLLYDHERNSPNRAAGHIHFRVWAATGSKLTFEFKNLTNVWNGTRASVSGELGLVVVSQDGKTWTPIPLDRPGDGRVRLTLTMPGPRLDVARVEPYRLSDLDRWLTSIKDHPLIEITPIGKTAGGRPLEIIRVGRDDAPNRVFLRARAHAWEPGGNWVIQGLVDRLLKGDAGASRFLERYCVEIMPMANKDGVALGRTRFNLNGKDLNRNWNKPADPDLSPENHALETWLESRIAQHKRPDIALELHNDGGGQLHLSRPPIPDLDAHLSRIKTFETLLRQHTWFTEGTTGEAFHNSGTLGEGWLARYGIDAAVHEFNVNRIAGLDDYPSAKHWMKYGADLATVFDRYFTENESGMAPKIECPLFFYPPRRSSDIFLTDARR